jgi:hypothetical protein
MDIFLGLGHFQNTIGAIACPSHMIVEMGGNMLPVRFGNGETPSSTGHGPPHRMARAKATAPFETLAVTRFTPHP